jgi:glyoxylase-like metal-dependent hydrolase (beta-lactamase superfamily II)
MGIQTSSKATIHTIDLKFQGRTGAIAAYLITHKNGVILVECGPGSTIPELAAGLNNHGYSVSDISDVLLTHIHLDHAGASGWLARQGANIHVHPVGAPHLAEPSKLLTSAGRIYGDQMAPLWGEFLPVPKDQITIHQDQEVIEIDDLDFRVLETPGHASHHFAYLHERVCFCGDIGGVRVAGVRLIRLPMAPPEFQPRKWRQSLEKLRQEEISHLLPTHFGVYSDVNWHLDAAQKAIEAVESWMESIRPDKFSADELNREFVNWENQRAQEVGLDPESLKVFETANPSWISTLGIQRYWRKYRNPE